MSCCVIHLHQKWKIDSRESKRMRNLTPSTTEKCQLPKLDLEI